MTCPAGTPKLPTSHGSWPSTSRGCDRPAATRRPGWSGRVAGIGSQVALLSATGYMEDQQITAYLAALLRQFGCTAHLAHLRQVRWQSGVAHLRTAWYRGPLDAVLRFYQGEWWAAAPLHRLAGLPARRADAGLQFRSRPSHREQGLPPGVGAAVCVAAHLGGSAAGDARPPGGGLAPRPRLAAEDGVLQYRGHGHHP